MPFLNPEDIVKQMNIEEGMMAADFGCGAGFYTIPIAKAVGSTGRVYAFDIRKEMLEMVRSKARQEHLLNIETVWADLETPQGTGLKDALVSRVVVSNILFQIDDKKNLIAEVHRVLKPGGLAVIVEWDAKAALAVPSKDRLVDKTNIDNLFIPAGFIREKEFYAGEDHYGVIFRKS